MRLLTSIRWTSKKVVTMPVSGFLSISSADSLRRHGGVSVLDPEVVGRDAGVSGSRCVVALLKAPMSFLRVDLSIAQ